VISSTISVADHPKRRLEPEEVARLRRQAHGVIHQGHTPPPLAPAPDATVRVALVESDALLTQDRTPPPLPPSPAASAAEVWLEEAVTRPSAFADIASHVGHAPTPPPHRELGASEPLLALREAHALALRSMRVLLVLSVATAFVVGLILGALVFRG
jgi:hypothetical protein